MYSLCNVACARNDHAPVQNGAPVECGESSSVVFLFTQTGHYYCFGVERQLVKIGVLVMLMSTHVNWSKFTLW